MSRAERAWYLAGPVSGIEERWALSRARDALTSRGHTVLAPALSHQETDSVDDLTASLGADLDALAAATLLVTLPGSAGLWETSTAVALGVPSRTLAEVLGERVSA
ncbi:DUF4406 domain-containing protein [Micromonospora arida]|uniref:DUF4406 domain-containing protein n=1 Tax=Micromonospora arida TaxID=2203715 RepID=UPI003CF39379